MPQLLYAIPFALEDRRLFADFSCGDEPWSLAAAEWIQGSGVETSVTHYGTKVWLFRRDSDDQLIGFGSLGRARRRWPPPTGPHINLQIIPQLAVDAIGQGAIVDAAHIHEFSDSRNNHLTNGMALCKNAHWLFDAGLWSVADHYRILVAKDAFSEDSPDQKPLGDYHGRTLRLPKDQSLWPAPKHLAWHRKHKFLGAA